MGRVRPLRLLGRLLLQVFEPGVDVAYVATGENFPDALSAAPIAGLTKSPVLLTRRTFLPTAISKELTRLKPKQIVVLGSDGVVSKQVREAQGVHHRQRRALARPRPLRLLGRLLRPVVHHRGRRRLHRHRRELPRRAVRGPGRRRHRRPDPPDPARPTARTHRRELDRLKPKKIVVLGGAGVASTDVQTQLEAYTTGTVDRWSGTHRFASARDFSSNAFAPGVDVAYIATGHDFPDALSAAPIAGMTRGPVLLANPSSLPSATSAELTRLRPKKIVVLGSDGVVSTGVQTQLQTYLR